VGCGGSILIRSRSSRSTGVCPSMPPCVVQSITSPVCGLISHRCSPSAWSSSAVATSSRQLSHRHNRQLDTAVPQPDQQLPGASEGEPWWVRFRQVPIKIRDQAVSIDAAAETPPQDLFRLLAPDHRDLLLADETERRQLVPADLLQVLRLDDWHHTALRMHRPGPERERQRQLHGNLARHTPPDKRVPFEVDPKDLLNACASGPPCTAFFANTGHDPRPGTTVPARTSAFNRCSRVTGTG
jgi:hypothetical protein